MAIFVAQRILCHSQSKLGYLLLQCIHHYINLDIYTGFELHTEDSIVAERQALHDFSVLMDPVTGEDWNFPKKHAGSHLFDNILAKGATQNYNTKPNKKMYGPVRDIYHNQINFKDVATQILHYDHWLLTLTSMHSELDELDEYNWNTNLPTTEYADTDNPAISVTPAPFTHADNKITGYKYLQVNYESMVDWRQCKDLL
ncbi:hypothetical protein EDD22DRAFT_852278 [Suillus occidentalis]|nr:hypothetical protein EDD22DRAFT_852278 [Suillus occidentalis]